MSAYGLYGGFPPFEGSYLRGLSKSPLPGSSETWGIARAFMPEGEVPVTITWAEMERDTEWAAAQLASMEIGAGDFCFYALMHRQSFCFWPWQLSTVRAGARFATGMPMGWDAYRLGMYLRLFRFKLLFGLAPETLDGLEAQGKDLSDLFGRTEILIALPGAWERLRAAGLKPWRLVWLGPIFAVDPCDGTGARYDSAQWILDSDQGRLRISSRDGRTTPFARRDTGVQGEVREDRLFMEC